MRPAEPEAGVPLGATLRLAQLAAAVQRAQPLEVPGLVAVLVRAALTPAVRHAEAAARGALLARGHLAPGAYTRPVLSST